MEECDLKVAVVELEEVIDVPDNPCTLTPGHSLGVLLLSFFLLLHNAIILLTIYNPKEEKDYIYIDHSKKS